jgi:integrase
MNGELDDLTKVLVRATVPADGLARFFERASRYQRASRSKRTLAEYAKQWRLFKTWCLERDVELLPCAPETLAMWLIERAMHVRVSTLAVALAAIAWVHRGSRFDSPTRDARVLELWEGIRREHGVAVRQVAPLTAAEVRAVCAVLPDSMVGARDRVVLALGMAAALRRSELAALRVEDVELRPDGLVVRVVRSKTDQVGAGVSVGVARGRFRHSCPVRAVQVWLELARLERGPLLRQVSRGGRVLERGISGDRIARLVKRSVAAAGLDPKRYSGHSLRAGLATTAARAGKSDRAIMMQGRWQGRRMVDRYVRDATLLDKSNASDDIGL